MSEPKTIQRRINFRKANRQMTRRRQDIPVEQLTPTNTEVLGKFTSETGKILPRRVNSNIPTYKKLKVTIMNLYKMNCECSHHQC
jgi:ribosomal protein S18